MFPVLVKGCVWSVGVYTYMHFFILMVYLEEHNYICCFSAPFDTYWKHILLDTSVVCIVQIGAAF